MTLDTTAPDRSADDADGGTQSTTAWRVLIADDDASIRSLLKEMLGDEGYEVVEVKSGAEVLRAVPKVEPNLVILDFKMPDMDGIEVLRRLGSQGQKVPVLMMTGFGSASTAIEATKLGAFDYVTKPFDVADVLHRVRQVFNYQSLASEVRKLRAELGRDLSERMIGNSQRMQDIYKTIGMISQTDANVLIMGETGAGKEVVADTIHHHSNYRNGPLVKVNLTALPETLVESELFGHEKGSFTGAVAQRKGRFEMAHKGTIFLDEIGDMTLSTQRKLLRVLQDKAVRARRREHGRQGRLPDRRGHQPQPEGRGRRRAVPRGPLLPPERRHHQRAAAERAQGRHPAADRALPGQVPVHANLAAGPHFRGGDADAGELRVARQRPPAWSTRSSAPSSWRAAGSSPASTWHSTRARS